MRIIKMISILSVVNLLLLPYFLVAQSVVVPPSPNVASLGKFGDIPVGLYTGIPEISIPIYEIKTGNLTLPISIDYHAGGIKVEEVASSVGLGWSLNAGGVIGRMIRGIEDEFSWFPVAQNSTIESIMLNGTEAQKQQLINDVYYGYKDGEPDLYYYNFDGYSGKFFFDQLGNAHTVPATDIKIKVNGVAPKWSITSPNGTVYSFNSEETASWYACGSDGINTTAWFLNSIASSDGKSVITFTYQDSHYVFENLVQETKYISLNTTSGCMDNSNCNGTTQSNTQRLMRIDFQDGYVKFNYNNVRCDLIDDKSLDEIEIFAKDNTLVKKFRLSYSYFGNNSDGPNRLTEKNKRLKLESITQENGSLNVPAHKFYYEESIPMPSRLSCAQDHWGYYNGKTNNLGLVATFINVNYNGSAVYEPGADRSVNTSTSQVGILKKIVYPTGGETQFTYENNTSNDTRPESPYRREEIFLSASNSVIPDPYQSSELVIPSGGAFVEYNIQGSDCLGPPPNWQDCDTQECFIEVIKDNGTTPYVQLNANVNGFHTFWPEGIYKLRARVDCAPSKLRTFSVIVTATIPLTPSDGIKPVGGLRIKRIEARPGDGGTPVVKNFKYHLENDSTKSSGILINFPDYGYDLTVEKREYEYRSEADPCAIVSSKTCVYRVRTSRSSYPLATTQGSYVGYSNVVTDYGPNGESWSSFMVYPDPTSLIYPFAPVEMYDWRRGKPVSKKEYKQQGTQLFPVSEESFSFSATNEFRVYGVRTGCVSILTPPCRTVWEESCKEKKFTYYPVITEFHFLQKKVNKDFDAADLNKFVETQNDFTYNTQHLQLSQHKVAIKKSDQSITQEVAINRKYPFDYTFTGTPNGVEALGIKKLQDMNVSNEIIEEYTVKQDRNASNQISNQRVVNGQLTTFRTDNPYPDKQYRLETDQAIPLGSFGSGSTITSNSFNKYSSYKPAITFGGYDIDGNILMIQKQDDIASSYIWGYGKLYPIAAIQNAASQSDIAQTSFEPEADGNWTYDLNTPTNPPDGFPLTGKRCFQVSSTKTVSKANLTTSKKYILSFWYKTGASITVTGGTQSEVTTTAGVNGWTLSTRKITGTTAVTLSGSGLIDELRLYPVEAQMTSYTYDPLIGMTSATDANNVVMYYNYDGLGRLVAIKDASGNILKSHSYHYKQ